MTENRETVEKPSPLSRVLIGKNPKRTLVRTFVLIAVCYVLFGFILLPIRVTGGSMTPTYRNGHIGLINRLSYLRGMPQRGDIVALRFAVPRVVLLKRIVGLPGETVSFRQGILHLNGVPLNEPYISERGPLEVRDISLAEGEYFYIGDNRAASQFGKIERDRIVGRILF
jgi:signal peptidase I